jgi:hypothetical protein
MSVSNIILRTGVNAGKINPELIVGGGGGGQVNSVVGSSAINVSADPVNPVVSVAFTASQDLMVGTGANAGAVLGVGGIGTYLGVNNAGVLAYSNPPQQGIAYNQEGQMIYAGQAPNFPDTLLNPGADGMILKCKAPGVGIQPVPTWEDAGGSGTITATAPLKEFAVAGASNIAIDFTARGDLVAGLGAQVGGNPVAGGIIPLGAQGSVLTATPNDVGGAGLTWVPPQPITGGQVQRITTPGTTTIPAPTTQNQQLQLIDIASTTNTFLYEKGAVCPNANFQPAGQFTNNIGGTFTMIVYGYDNTANVGQVWGYIPNLLVANLGTWYKWIETGVGQSIGCGSCLQQFPQDFGGYNASDMVFGGNIQDLTFFGVSAPPQPLGGLTNFFYWELSPEQVVNPNFTTYNINPYPKGGLGCGGVASNGNADEIKFIVWTLDRSGSLLVNTPAGSVEYNGFAMITKAIPVVSAIIPLSGGLPSTVNGFFGYNSADAGINFINSINWTFNGNLCIFGGFISCKINGATQSVGNSWITLQYDPTPGSINGFVALGTPQNPGINGNVQQVNNCYDPSTGVAVMGDYSIGVSSGISIITLAGSIIAVDVASPGSGFTNGLVVDGGSYIGSLDFAQQLIGIENGYIAQFGVPQSLFWFMPKIAQGFPVSYIGMSGKEVYQGYFKITANQTTIQFAPARLRYALSSGTTGLAQFAILNSVYSSMTLIGDLTVPATPQWDLVAMTGNISFS